MQIVRYVTEKTMKIVPEKTDILLLFIWIKGGLFDLLIAVYTFLT